MRKRIVILASVVAATIFLLIVSIGAVKRTSRTASPAANSTADNQPLKDRAKQAGRFTATQSPSGTAYAGLAELASHSSAVIIGTPQTNVCQLSPDGMSVSIDYKVRVEYVYKGALRQGNNVTVSLPGGIVKFADGSTAEVRTPWFKKMEDGKTYALFLIPNGDANSFVTTGEAQGVFEIPTTKDNRTVKVHTGIARDTMWKYHNMDVKAFLKELRQVTGKLLKN